MIPAVRVGRAVRLRESDLTRFFAERERLAHEGQR
jgi:hypothetical protein